MTGVALSPEVATPVVVATEGEPSDGGELRRQRWEHRRHVGAVAVSAMAIGATVAGWTPGPATTLAFVVVAVIAGLPHGALDIVIGPTLTTRGRFIVQYLVFVAAVIVAWLIAPMLSLCVFLLTSWFHFARGDSRHHPEIGSARTLLGLSTAGCAIGLPLALQAEVVAPVFADLLLGADPPTTDQLAALGTLIAYPAVVAGIVAAAAAIRTRRPAALVEVIVIAGAAAVLHPLISFALYFALWHSPRHVIEQDLDASALLPTLAATVATLVGALVVWRVAEPSAQVATQVIFIGLAALTGPHLVVTELARRRSSS